MTLDNLLARWAEQHRLTLREAAAIRDAARTEDNELDPDWLWGLLRPVAALLDGPHQFADGWPSHTYG